MSTLEVKGIQAPSGFDLDMPAGHIVQVKSVRGDFSEDVSSSSASYVELHTSLRNTFTPKFANSTLIFEYNACSVGHSTTYIKFQIFADGANLDTVAPSDHWRTHSGSDGESPVNVYLEAPSWGTTGKVISPYFASYAAGTVVKGNWGGSSPMCYMKVTEVAG